jgi:hypothetical protein
MMAELLRDVKADVRESPGVAAAVVLLSGRWRGITGERKPGTVDRRPGGATARAELLHQRNARIHGDCRSSRVQR